MIWTRLFIYLHQALRGDNCNEINAPILEWVLKTKTSKNIPGIMNSRSSVPHMISCVSFLTCCLRTSISVLSSSWQHSISNFPKPHSENAQLIFKAFWSAYVMRQVCWWSKSSHIRSDEFFQNCYNHIKWTHLNKFYLYIAVAFFRSNLAMFIEYSWLSLGITPGRFRAPGEMLGIEPRFAPNLQPH